MALTGTFRLEHKLNVNHTVDVKLIEFIVYYATDYKLNRTLKRSNGRYDLQIFPIERLEQ